MAEQVLLICGKEVAAYGFPDGHPFGPDRHDAFMTELRQPEIDPQRLRGLIAQKQEQMNEIIDLAVTRLTEFHRTLTPEQKEKLAAKLEYFQEQHQSHWE